MTIGWTAVGAFGDELVWYNGLPDLENGLSAEVNTVVSSSFTFEDFDHDGRTITKLYGNYFFDSELVVSGYAYEIRSGVSNGFEGTLHASGQSAGGYAYEPNGYDYSDLYKGYWFACDIPDVAPGAGRYMVALSVVGAGGGRAFVASSSGMNGVGTPVDNDLNWFRSEYFEEFYTENYLPHEYSYGVIVPAPAVVLALVGIGLPLVGRRR